MSLPVYFKTAMTTIYRQHTYSGVKKRSKDRKNNLKKVNITAEEGEGGKGVKLNVKEVKIGGGGETRRKKEGRRR